MNLLIVDDDPTSLKLLRTQLEYEGHAVFEAYDGVDALAVLERQRVDAVISDILMPRMDGYRLCYEIRKHARLHDLPIIIYTTTYTSLDDEKLALDVGADKYLKKPVSVETIIAALHEVTAMPHAARHPKALQEVEVPKEYSEKLVSKLKERNAELTAEIAERKRAEEALHGYATRLRELSHRLRTVEETERHAISRELHDRIGQDMSTLGLILGSLGAKLSQESLHAVHKQLQDMQGLLKSMVANVRDIMAELRPPALDDYGLLAALRQLVTEFAKRTGIAAELSGVELQPRLPSIVETAMFRISQEALNNIAKHAQAKNVEVSLYAAPDRVVLDITDDGIGFDANETQPDKQHWGLITMRERAEAVAIAFSLESAPGAGTRIALEAERAPI